MKILGAKKYIITVWVLLTTLVFSVFGFVSVNFINSKKPKQQTNASSGYTFSSESGQYFGNANNVNYKGYTDFYIGSPGALLNFSISVGNGCSFSGKNVYLTNNIDWSGYGNFPPIGSIMDGTKLKSTHMFEGNFDGQNYIIDNISIKIQSRQLGIYMKAGLFADVNFATIQNLGITNFSLNYLTDAPYNDNPPLGVIAGAIESSTTISHCMITNANINSTYDSVSIGALAGIWGCIGHTYMEYPIENVFIKDFTASGVYECVSIIGSKYVNTGTIKISKLVVSGNDNLYELPTIDTITAEYVHSTPNSTTGLNYSSAGGPSDTIWYYVSDYNNGFPCLRAFMSWKTITFTSENTTKGTVSPSSIYIPSDAFANFSTYDAKLNKFSTYLEIYDQAIRARANTGFGFDKWVSSISTTSISYTAYFTEDFYRYEFADLVIDGVTIEPTCSTFESGTKRISIRLGTDAEITCEHKPTATIIRYEIGGHVVTYTITLVKYTMDESGKVITNRQVDSYYNEDLEVAIEDFHLYHDTYYWPSKYTFEVTAPKLKLKNYNVNFQ